MLVLVVAPGASGQLLSVSAAESPIWQNRFSGAQVIEVVVSDPDISNTTVAQVEPDVTVDGKQLRMVQAVDGNWYGYLVQQRAAVLADSTAPAEGSPASGNGLDFGTFCSPDSGVVVGLAATGLSDTKGFAIPLDHGVDGGTAGAPLLGAITHTCLAGTGLPVPSNVVRAPPTPAPFPQAGTDAGQIGIDEAAWPFVQLYLLPLLSTVVIQYNHGSSSTVVLLWHEDLDFFASFSLDRNGEYPRDSDVHLTVQDVRLNIDPTQEDSWTFGSNAADPITLGGYYRVFDESGNQAGDSVAGGVINLASTLLALRCAFCQLVMDPDPLAQGTPIMTLQDNGITGITGTLSEDPSTFQSLSGQLPAGSLPITLTETGPNTGIFSSTDAQGRSTLRISAEAPRGLASVVEYNDDAAILVVRHFFADIDLQPVNPVWGGEAIPVQLYDGDLNKNTLVAEKLNVSDPKVEHVPSLVIGQPVTLEDLSSAMLQPQAVELFGTVPGAEDIEEVSQRAFLRVPAGAGLAIFDGDEIRLDLGITFQQLYAALPEPGATPGTAGPTSFRGVDLLNFDLRSLFDAIGAELDDVTISIQDSTDTVAIATHIGSEGLVDLADEALVPPVGFFDLAPLDAAVVVVTLNTSAPATLPAGAVLPIVVDFFSFGYTGTSPAHQEVVNMIARLELQETAPNTASFTGSVEFEMQNQLSVLDPQTYLGLASIGEQAKFILGTGLVGVSAPKVEYRDIDISGIPLIIADDEDAPSHSADFSLDARGYSIGDTVTITVDDQDLNLRADVIDVYTLVSAPHVSDPAFATIGAPGLPDDFVTGALGRMLEVEFDGVRWRTPQGSCDLTGVPDTGFDDSLFTLLETGVDTGVFQGSFQIPSRWCRADDGSPETTGGLQMVVRYVDYRDAGGQVKESGRVTPVAATCTIDMTLGYTPGALDMDFLLGTTAPASWGVWIFSGSTFVPLWSLGLPVIDPPVALPTLSLPVPQSGNLLFVTGLVDVNSEACWDWGVVDTGP